MEPRHISGIRFLGFKEISVLNIALEGSICSFCNNRTKCEKIISDELKKLGITSFRLTVYSCKNFKLKELPERKPLII